jgi:hypothetical protein
MDLGKDIDKEVFRTHTIIQDAIDLNRLDPQVLTSCMLAFIVSYAKAHGMSYEAFLSQLAEFAKHQKDYWTD